MSYITVVNNKLGVIVGKFSFNPSSFDNIFEDTVVDDLYWIKSHASFYCNVSELS